MEIIAEPIAEHHLEPEVASPPPRRAQLAFGTNLLLAVAAFLFAIIFYGGLRALGEGLKLTWVAAAGKSITAKIIKVEAAPVQSGQAARQAGVRYAYSDLNGRSRQAYARLYAPDSAGGVLEGRAAKAAPTPVFHVGDRLLLRAAPWPGGAIMHPWSPPPTSKILFLCIAGLLVSGVSALLMRRILRWRQHRLHLLRNGVATIGTILHKKSNADDSLRYYLHYGYAADGIPQEREEQCSPEQWKTLEVGQSVTVLYDPKQPAESGLYLLLEPAA